VNQNWPLCTREAHILGGAIAVNEANDNIVRIWPDTLDGKKAQLTLPSYQGFFNDIEKFGCYIVGVDFITNKDEVVGASPPQWRTYAKQSNNIWEHWETIQKWGQIASRALEIKNGFLSDISYRIKYQLRSISDGLRLLSLSYRCQLKAQIIKKRFSPDRMFEDGYTGSIYRNFQSFLFDCCILRDYLAEFIYNFSEDGSRKKDSVEITTASGFLKKILSKVPNPNIIEKEFLEISAETGWLYKLGAYRDLVMHAAPIAIAHHRLLAVRGLIDLLGDKKLPIIRCPLPEDPSLINRIRSNRNIFNEYLNRIDDFRRASQGEIGKFDCLQYAHEVSRNLVCLAATVIKLSPVAPKMVHFTEEDIIDIKISKDGE
jgi:hypothetical protein